MHMTTAWLLVLAVLLGAGILRYKVLPQWHRRRISASWPMAKAVFGSGSVTQELVTGENGGVTFHTEILYSYSVLGTVYPGTYSETFGSREEAEQLLQSLRQGPLFVRYNPAAPGDCFMDPYRDVTPVAAHS
jgi:hypothetical protein